MTDLDKAELVSWLRTNHEGWQRVQKYIDIMIDEAKDESLEYIKTLDRDGLCEIKGSVTALEKVRNLLDILS